MRSERTESSRLGLRRSRSEGRLRRGWIRTAERLGLRKCSPERRHLLINSCQQHPILLEKVQRPRLHALIGRVRRGGRPV
ncbi:hypothetical protein BN903_23 [Halorubrum sp. AJ67]|nr:hypothetical protein BN903_23 [Halorubrum sp. AJ67]